MVLTFGPAFPLLVSHGALEDSAAVLDRLVHHSVDVWGSEDAVGAPGQAGAIVDSSEEEADELFIGGDLLGEGSIKRCNVRECG